MAALSLRLVVWDSKKDTLDHFKGRKRNDQKVVQCGSPFGPQNELRLFLYDSMVKRDSILNKTIGDTLNIDGQGVYRNTE